MMLVAMYVCWYILYIQIYVYVARSLARYLTLALMIDGKQLWKVMKINNWLLKMSPY